MCISLSCTCSCGHLTWHKIHFLTQLALFQSKRLPHLWCRWCDLLLSDAINYGTSYPLLSFMSYHLSLLNSCILVSGTEHFLPVVQFNKFRNYTQCMHIYSMHDAFMEFMIFRNVLNASVYASLFEAWFHWFFWTIFIIYKKSWTSVYIQN